MHVLFLSYHLPMPEEPGAFRPWMEARLLKQAGYEVTVITSGVQYMTGKDIRNGSGWCTQHYRDGICILRTWAPKAHRGYIYKRVFNYLCYTFLAGIASVVKVRKVNRVFAGTDPIFMMPMVYLVSKIKRVPMIMDERDLFPETAIALGVIKEGVLSKLLFAMQQFYRKKAYSILAATPGIMEHLISCGCAAQKMKLLYNGDVFLNEDTRENATTIELRAEIGKTFLLGYTGGLGMANDIMTLLRAAMLLKDIEDMGIAIIGEGERRSLYEDYCKDNGLHNVYFTGPVARYEARALLHQIDVCIHLYPKHALFTGALASKIFDYLAIGKPIIFCGTGDTAVVIESSGAGVVVPPGNEHALAQAIRHIRNNPAISSMGMAGRAWFEENIGLDASIQIMNQTIA